MVRTKGPSSAKNTISAEGGENADGHTSLFTTREQRMIVEAIATMNVNGLPPINTYKVAERLGLSNHRSVQNAWAIIKRKITEERVKNGEVDNEPADTPNESVTPRKRGPKAKAAAASDNDAAADRVKTGRVTKPKRPPHIKAGPGTLLHQDELQRTQAKKVKFFSGGCEDNSPDDEKFQADDQDKEEEGKVDKSKTIIKPEPECDGNSAEATEVDMGDI
ncbi:hypothetical protein VTI74DRAFT_9722 [Chaetomium olivicolor]